MKKILIIHIFIYLFISYTAAQNIWENTNSQVYLYLNRMSQKGFIQIDDLIKPIVRNDIQFYLNELTKIQDQLTNVEKKELDFYLQEYKYIKTYDSTVHIMKKDVNKRWRFFNQVDSNFEIHADPLLGINTFKINNQNILQISNGFEIWGAIGKNKNLGFQIYYRDYTEKGNIKSRNFIESNLKGNILVGNQNNQSINYTDIKVNLNYKINNLTVSVGKNNLIWGYGENGNIVLSDKAPSYPNIRLDYKPIKWLKFNYTHAWLNSNLIDSNLSYLNNSGRFQNDQRIIFIPKYLANHSIQINPYKGVFIAVGESIIYSDKMDIGFLIPINLFKFYDNNRSNYLIEAGSNGQYFISINTRNLIKNNQSYFTLFIDEIRFSALFNEKNRRNQLGLTIGTSFTDIFVPYLTLGAEYTRVNPFVYNNLLPTQTYKNFNYNLGDWMGNNFDRIILYMRYNPFPKLEIYTRLQNIRKGGEGTIYQQYELQPQPKFLNNLKYSYLDIFFRVRYELINNLYLNYQNESRKNFNHQSFGLTFGL